MMYRDALTPFYRIGDLARALNRSAGTIRKWEAAGIIPKASFGEKTEGALGDSIRLYSLAQIRVAREIAAGEGILRDTSKAVTHTDFAARVAAAWKELWLPAQRRRSRSSASAMSRAR